MKNLSYEAIQNCLKALENEQEQIEFISDSIEPQEEFKDEEIELTDSSENELVNNSSEEEIEEIEFSQEYFGPWQV